MSESEAHLQPFPFEIPAGFVERLRYRQERRLVGVHTDGGRCTITDGVDTLIGADHHVWGELMHQPQVRDWLWVRAIDLGSDLGPPSHWLLVDRTDNQGYLCPAKPAWDKVRTQRLDE
jgi:hypothetical protein